MNKENLNLLFDFIQNKEGKQIPFLWKFKNNIPLTEDDLNIKGDLILTYSDIESLPEGLKVSGTLDLSYSKIISLPKGMEVGGTLFLHFSKITSLPKGLEIGEHLFIGKTPLTKYSDEELREMIKPGFIKGKIVR